MIPVVFLGGVSHLKLLMTNSFCILQKAINFPDDELSKVVPPLGLGNTSQKIIELIKTAFAILAVP